MRRSCSKISAGPSVQRTEPAGPAAGASRAIIQCWRQWPGVVGVWWMTISRPPGMGEATITRSGRSKTSRTPGAWVRTTRPVSVVASSKGMVRKPWRWISKYCGCVPGWVKLGWQKSRLFSMGAMASQARSSAPCIQAAWAKSSIAGGRGGAGGPSPIQTQTWPCASRLGRGRTPTPLAILWPSSREGMWVQAPEAPNRQP